MEGSKKCDKDHDPILHGSGTVYCSSAGVSVLSNVTEMVRSVDQQGAGQCSHIDSTVLLEIQKVNLPVNKVAVITIIFFDNGSTATTCTHSWAECAGVKGVEIIYYMSVVGEAYTRRNTQLYNFTITDADGMNHQIEALIQ